jgi:AcrR family transcriptional regulator
MTRKRSATRREEILQAAAAEMLECGIGNVRAADVAARLDVSQALIFYHFATKERLITQAFEYHETQFLARLDAIVGRSSPAPVRLRAALRLYAPSGGAPGWILLFDAWATARRVPGLRKTLRELDARWRAGLAEIIVDGVAEGTLECADPDGAAARIIAYLDGLSVALVARQRNLTKKQALHWLSAAIRDELGLESFTLD